MKIFLSFHFWTKILGFLLLYVFRALRDYVCKPCSSISNLRDLVMLEYNHQKKNHKFPFPLFSNKVSYLLVWKGSTVFHSSITNLGLEILLFPPLTCKIICTQFLSNTLVSPWQTLNISSYAYYKLLGTTAM